MRAHTNGSYIDPWWKPTCLVSCKGESVAGLCTHCEEVLRAFIGGYRRPGPSSARCSPGWCQCCSLCARRRRRGGTRAHTPRLACHNGHRARARAHGRWGGVRKMCCTPTALCRSPFSTEAPPSSSTTTSTSPPTPTPKLGGREVWTVRGTPADGRSSPAGWSATGAWRTLRPTRVSWWRTLGYRCARTRRTGRTRCTCGGRRARCRRRCRCRCLRGCKEIGSGCLLMRVVRGLRSVLVTVTVGARAKLGYRTLFAICIRRQLDAQQGERESDYRYIRWCEWRTECWSRATGVAMDDRGRLNGSV
jgi:hypothetical protein